MKTLKLKQTCPETLRDVKSVRDYCFYEIERQLSKKRVQKKRRKELETLKSELVDSIEWSTTRFYPTSTMKFVARETMSVLAEIIKMMQYGDNKKQDSRDFEREFNQLIYDVYTSQDRKTMGRSIVELLFVAGLECGLFKLTGVKNEDITEIHWITMSRTDTNICKDCGLMTTKDQGIDVVVRLKNGKFHLVQIK